MKTGTLVVYTSRVSTDQVGGFGGSAKRTIGSKLLTSELKRSTRRREPRRNRRRLIARRSATSSPRLARAARLGYPTRYLASLARR